MKVAVAVLIGLLPWLSPAALGGPPPPPNRAAIVGMAQREDPGIPYVAGLPERHVECDALAQPYFDSPGSGHAVAAGTIMTQCHIAMLAKIAELHYGPDAFGPGGMAALANQLLDDFGRLYQGIHDGPIDCLRNCGSILYEFASAHKGAEFEYAVETMALLHVPPPERDKWLETWNRAGWVR